MIKWKNLLLSYKLAISYTILILVFLIAGLFTGINLQKYKKELSFTTRAYIPLIENTNRIERLTNQSMNYLWEFNALGESEYYDLSKSTLKELSRSLTETDSIISISPQLLQLKTRLVRIKNWVNELNIIIDETNEIHKKLQKNQVNLRTISQEFEEETEKFIKKEENKLTKAIKESSFSPEELVLKHYKNRRTYLIINKGKRCMVNALEAIVSEDPEHLKSAIKEFKYIFNLINVIDSSFNEPSEYQRMETFKNYFSYFQEEIFSLKKNLATLKELNIKQIESANVVIYEAKAMGEDGVKLSGKSLKNNYEAFNRLGPIFLLVLLIALVLSVIFSLLITRSITIPLERNVRFAEEIASGNLDATVQIDSNDEVGILAKSLKYMGIKLKENMSNLKKAERKMLTISIETEEKERKRMAEDLHDSLGPLLSATKLFINSLKSPSLTKEKQKYLIDSAEKVIADAIASAKDVAYNLSPNLLRDFGLEMAIRSFCNQIEQASNVKIIYLSEDYPSNYNRKVETMLFRILKELLNNTIKYAEAKTINIKLYFEDQFFQIDYNDDGKGFEMDSNNITEKETKHGLVNIFNRINYIKGNIDFKSSIGNGVQVKIWVDKKYLV